MVPINETTLLYWAFSRIQELEKELYVKQTKETKIKRSECPYGGIDCAWCDEICE